MRGRDSLPPIVFQLVGIAIAVFFVLFWAATALLGAAIQPPTPLLGLATLLFSFGQIRDARDLLDRRGPDTPPSPPTKETV